MAKKYNIAPWRGEIDRAFEEVLKSMEKIRENFFRMLREPFGEEIEVLEPSIDIIDKGDHYLVEVDVPGFNKEDIEINVIENEIEIKGEKKKEEKEERKNYIRRERTYASFYRRAKLDEEILPEESSAKIENGVLKIILKKKHPKKEGKRINIE
ncbi:MAG: Hsp20/alpha crystallin family protein [Candidatus Altarchaeaceae archaeon]